MSCPEIAYPEIEFKWFERGGLQFQVQFINKEYMVQQELQQELQQESLYIKILRMMLGGKALSIKEISEKLGQKAISGQLNRVVRKLVDDNLLARTIAL